MKPTGMLGVLAALALTACVNTYAETALDARQALIGMPKSVLLSCAGVPERQATVDNREFLTYASDRIESRQTGMMMYGGRHHFAWEFPQTQVYSESCEATFTLRNGRVERLVYGGDAIQGAYSQCYMIVRNCMETIPLP